MVVYLHADEGWQSLSCAVQATDLQWAGRQPLASAVAEQEVADEQSAGAVQQKVSAQASTSAELPSTAAELAVLQPLQTVLTEGATMPVDEQHLGTCLADVQI